MDDTFQKFAPLIPAAIQNLDAFSVWYRENFDTNLHHKTTSMLEDAALMFGSAHHFLLLWRNCEYMVLDRRASSRCTLGLDRCAPLFGTIVHWMMLL